jgi:hypothetical protein
MRKTACRLFCITLTVVIGFAERSAAEPKVKLRGGLQSYYIHQDSSYFAKTSSHFVENIVRCGVDIEPDKNISGTVLLNAQNCSGDAVDYTGISAHDWDFEVELANITFKELITKPFSLTLGRQDLEYGDGFLIFDGYTDPRAFWVTPIRRFTAVKGTYETGPFNMQGFAAMVDKEYKSYETYFTDASYHAGYRNLYGADIHLGKDDGGSWDLGLFYKDDNSDLKSDTLAISQRGSYTFNIFTDVKARPQVKLEGEVVEEVGRTNVKDFALVNSRQDRRSIGGHIDATLALSQAPFTPYIKASYIYLPGDDPDTARNETFDPFFFGSYDWGRWFLGSISCFSLFNYNERVVMSEIGLSPTEKTKLRAQYFYLNLDRQITVDAGRAWAHEVNVIFDYFPKEGLSFGVELGYAHPLKAAVAYSGDDRDTTEVICWIGLNF